MCQHMRTCRHVLICADMCRYVPKCTITLGISDTNHLDLIWMLACVSTCGHADMCWYVTACADMCQHVAPLSASLIQTIWTSSVCWHVSAHVDMPTCADMCRHVLTRADMRQHVASFSAPLMPTIWTSPQCWHVSAHVDMPICADMCQLSAPLIPIIGNLSVCKMSIYPVRFTYLLDRFKTKRFKAYSWDDKFQEHFPKYKI